MNKLFVYLYRIILKNAKNSIMKMIKKYWWLLALGALAYWKWDEVKAMLKIGDKGEKPVDPLYGPMNLPDAAPGESPFAVDNDGNDIPDYLQA